MPAGLEYSPGFGRELRWRDAADPASRVDRNKCARSAAAVGHIKFRSTDAACLFTTERRVH